MHETRKYKTAVTDYEGMQGILDTHTAQGWKLFSLTADTWRKNTASTQGMETPAFEQLNGSDAAQEYSASYYLLVFERDETLPEEPHMVSLEEILPHDRPAFEM